MEYFILTESEFFHQIDNDSPCRELKTAYDEFVVQVIELLSGTGDLRHTFFAITYAEIELQYHASIVSMPETVLCLYIRKALTFIRKMLKLVAAEVRPLTPLTLSNHPKETVAPALQWTGNAIDLVEMIYGINEMGCINGGEMPLKELAPILYSFFGVESKDCYRFYTDIKRRKNESRTYFLDKMQVKLNERMRRDEEVERLRR